MKAIFEVNEIVQGVEDGNLNALESFIKLKRLAKGLKEAIATIQEEAVENAGNYGAKTFKAYDAEVTCQSAAGKWDFKKLSWWDDFESKKDDAKNSYKLIAKGKKMVDDDGVVVDPAMYTPGADNLKLKL